MGTSPVRPQLSPSGFRTDRVLTSWNTARTLSDYLLRHPSSVKGRCVLELGAGAGLPSLVSALAGAKGVVITDYPDEELVKTIRWNVETNLPEEVLRRVDVKVSWGNGKGLMG